MQMLAIELEQGWVPLSGFTDYYVEKNEEGEESLSFDIHKENILYQNMKSLVRIKSDTNIYSIISNNKPAEIATITAELDMNEWKTEHFLKCSDIPALQTKTITEVLEYIKPIGWTIVGAEFKSIKRTPDCEKCNQFDILMRCKTIYDVQYDIDTISKTITVIDPYAIIDDGVYITPELNMTGLDYKETGTGMVTRLYCYGADDRTFASINGGKPYVENFTYTKKIITSQWVDGRYYDMSNFLSDAQKKIDKLAVPIGCYTINAKNLAAYDERYKDIEFKLRHIAHCIINPENNVDVIHKVVSIRRYPNDESETIVTLSNEPRTIENELKIYQENVTELTRDGYKKETTIRNNSESIELIAEKTDQNTKGIQKVEQQITPEQLLVTVSDSINNGNKLNTMQVIIDLLGLTIKNGGIRVYDGNNNLVLYVDQNTKKLNFSGTISGTTLSGSTITGSDIKGTLFDGGTIKTNDGNIGGWNIDSDGLYNGAVKINKGGVTNIYTWADLGIIQLTLLGGVNLGNEVTSHYDFNGDGKVTSADYVYLKNRLIEL